MERLRGSGYAKTSQMKNNGTEGDAFAVPILHSAAPRTSY
jgi:hypothetical protein